MTTSKTDKFLTWVTTPPVPFFIGCWVFFGFKGSGIALVLEVFYALGERLLLEIARSNDLKAQEMGIRRSGLR